MFENRDNKGRFIKKINSNCRFCNVELNKENWYDYNKEKKDYICKQCSKREYYEKRRDYIKDWNRHNRLCTNINGKIKIVRVKKRRFNGFCELCKKEISHPNWHHWNNNKLELGMWLCAHCHTCVEYYESKRLEEYLKLKDRIERGTQ